MTSDASARPALTAPPLTAETAERVRALLGLAVRRRPDLPVGIHSRPQKEQ